MREIRLYGHLGEAFGRSFMLDVKSPGEAISALCANFRTFKKELLKHGISGYKVIVGQRALVKQELGLQSKDSTIKFVPIVGGSSGLPQIIIGAVLIVVGGIVSGMSFGLAAPIGGAMINLGWGMVASGVISSLISPPSTNQAAEKADNQPSYVFNGAVNTTKQGNAVSILIGEMIVGSQVISGGITSEEVLIAGSSASYEDNDGGSAAYVLGKF